MENSFILDIIAKLNKQLSKRSINGDLKSLDNTMYVKVIAKLSKMLSSRELKRQFKELNNLRVEVGAELKNGTKEKLQKNIQDLQKSIADIEIGLKASKLDAQMQSIRERVNKKFGKGAVGFDIEIRKEKVIADIEYLSKKYSKLFTSVSATQKYENILNAAYRISDAGDLGNVRAQLAVFNSELKNAGLAAQSTGDKWKRLIERSKELFSAATVIRMIYLQMQKAVSTTIELDKAYTGLVKVSDELSRGDYADYLAECNKKAQELATSQKALIEGAEEFSKSGYNLDTSNKLTEKSTVLSNVGEMSAPDSAKAIISGVQAYDEIGGYTDTIDKAEELINILNLVGNTASITTAELAKGVQSVGSVFADSNTDLSEFVSLLGAANCQYQDADSLALALRTSALRIRGASAELEEAGEDVEGVMSVLKNQEKIKALTGVNILEDDGQTIRSIYDIFLDISKVYKDMNDVDQSALLELIAGKHRASAISATLNNMTEAEELLQKSLHAAGSAEKEYNAYLASTEAHIQQFQSKLVETYSTLMDGNMISHVADLGTAILDLVNKTDLLKHGLVSIAALKIGQTIATVGGAIAGAATQMHTLGNALQMVKSLPVNGALRVAALKQAGDATKTLTEKNLKLLLSQKQLDQSDRMRILQAHQLTDEEALAKLETMGLTAATNANTAANTANAASANTLKGAFTGLAASVKATWAAMSMLQKASVIFAAISIAWSIGSSIFSSMKQREEEMVQAANDAKTAITEIKSDFDNLSSTTDDIKQRFAELAQGVENLGKANQSRGKLSTEDYEEFLGLSNQLAGLFPQLTTGYDDNGNAILNLSGNVNTIVGSLNDLVLVQQKLANQQILEKMPDVWKGYASDLNEYNKELGVSKEQVDAYQTALNKISSGDGRTLTTDSYFEQHAMINAARKIGLDDGKWYQNKLAEMSNETYENGEFQYAEWDFSSLTDEQIEQLKNELGALGAEYEKSVQQTKGKIESANADMSAYINTWLSGEWNYSKMDAGMQNVVKDILLNTDWLDVLPENIDADNWEEVSNWLQNEFLYAVNAIDDEKIQTALVDAFNGEFTVESIQEIIRQLLTTYGFDANNPLVIHLQTKLNDRKAKVYDVNKKLGSDDKAVTDWIDSLNDKELELAGSDEFEQAIEIQKEKLNGAALAAADYEAALKSLENQQEELEKSRSFSKIFSDSAGLEIDNIIAQFNAGKITPETIDSFEVFHDVMRKTGQTAEEVYEELEKFAEDFVSTDDMISNLEAMHTTMRDVKKEVEELGYISAGTLSGIADKYPQLSSALTQYTSGLITEQDLIRQMEVLYQNDVESYRIALTAKLQYDTTFFANVKKHNQDFFAELAKAYNLDVQNWRSLAQAKADIDTRLIQNLAKTWSKYYNIILDAETGLYTAQSNQDLTGLSAEESVAAIVRGTEVRAQVNSVNEVIKKLDSLSSLEVEVPDFKNPSDSSKKGGSGSKNAAKKESQTIDWIARKLERLQEIIDLTKSKFENLFNVKSKSSNIKKQITQTTDLLNAAIKAAQKYKKYADGVQLSTNAKKDKELKKLVQSGSYNIREYSSDMADKINQYKEYYDNYKEQLGEIEELKKSIRELQIEQYQLKADYQKSRVEKLSAQYDVTTSTKKKNELENKRIKALKKQYEYEIKIAKAEGDTIKAKQLELELEKEIIASKKAKFDNIVTKYENRANRKGYRIQDIENKVALTEAKGSYVNADYYNKQYEEQEALAKMYAEEEKKLQERLGTIRKYSDEWYEALETIQDVQNKENDALVAMEELADKVNDVAKSLDDLIINKFSTMIGEADTLLTLLGDRLVDDDLGDFTNNGIAALGLIYSQMQAENEKGDHLRKQLAILEAQKASYKEGETVSFIDANGMKRTISSLKELNELEEDARKNVQESAKAKYSYYKGIIDLMRERYDAEKNYLDDLIAKKKELLDAEQDLHQYAKDIKEQTDNIASLQKQLAALSGDNSLEGQARRQKIEAQLQESEDTLAETEYDRLISDQKDMLDNLSNEFAEMMEAYTKDEETLYKEGLAIIKENPSLINEVTTSVADKWGMELSGEMESVVENINLVDSTLNGIRSDLQNYFASTQQDKKDTSDTSSDRFMSGDISSIKESLSDLADHSSKRGNSDTGLEGKELNVMKGVNWKPLNSTNGNASGGNSTDKLVSMGSSKIATKFNHDQSLGEKKDDEEKVYRVDMGDGEITELVKAKLSPEWEALRQSLGASIPAVTRNIAPSADYMTKQLIENAPTYTENYNGNVNIENVTFSFPEVDNYEKFMTKAKNDPNFEGMIGHMFRTQLTGGNRLDKYRARF